MRIVFILIGNSRRSNYLDGNTLRYGRGGGSGTDTSTIVVTSSVGINNDARLNFFDITPNPSKGLLKLNVVSTNSNELKLQVIDQLGKIILEREFVGTNNKVSDELNLSSLPKGIYFIRAEMGDASETKKVVIE